MQIDGPLGEMKGCRPGIYENVVSLRTDECKFRNPSTEIKGTVSGRAANAPRQDFLQFLNIFAPFQEINCATAKINFHSI